MSGADENVWAESAVPATFHPPLAEQIRTDVAVIGAGYCGLSAALHLADAGAQAVVIDAHQPGWGASGRNGGQVIPGFKYDPDELEAMFGSERGERIWRFGAGTADCAFDLIARHRMDVTTRRAGWVQGIHSEKAAVRGRRRAAQWQRRGAAVAYLDAAATAEILGTELYRGSVIDRRGGALQPLSYARELARVASACGARIFGETIAARLERRGTGWQVHCHNGTSIQADRVLVCTNAYSDTLVPGLANSIIAANSLQVATEPLPDEWRARIMPRGEVLSDTRKVIRYWRLDDRGRLLMGGRGPYREPHGEADWAHLVADIAAIFPMLARLRCTHRWAGRVAIHADFMPRLHEPSPGLLVAIGCQGRGIGLQTAMGIELARRARDRAYDPPLPVTSIDPIPLHAFKAAGTSAVVAWYRVMDRIGLS